MAARIGSLPTSKSYAPAEFAQRDPADRLELGPGGRAQCDLWFPPAGIPIGGDLLGSPPVSSSRRARG